MWATWPEILKNYAKHHETGAPLPAELLAKVTAAAQFNQGFKTTEDLAATLLDQAWHQLAASEIPAADGVLAFEAAALKKYRSPVFLCLRKLASEICDASPLVRLRHP
jgi:peptidyl-dipeptidase Dcp